MITETFTVLNPAGFHARPVKMFVQQAKRFPCKVYVSKDGRKVNGKSSISMLTLGLALHDEVTLELEGEEAEEALQQLGEVLMTVFDE